MSRRRALAQIGAAAAAVVSAGTRAGAQAPTRIVVYKDPTCMCCHKWVDHMTANGFAATITDTEMAEIHALYKLPVALQSCHTAVVSGFVIEGHVPAADVKRLLAEKPKDVRGLTIPGMPTSAPGMDGKPFQPFTVLSFDAKNATQVFATHDRA